jgi:hypothetical protein
MGAELDHTGKSLFVFDKPELNHGAVAIGMPNFAGSFTLNSTPTYEVRDAKQYTWLVCPHLCDPDSVFKYYLASGLITIVLGKCFCETCLDRIFLRGDLTDLVRASRPMTDRSFQEKVINPLISSNFAFSKIWQYIGKDDESPQTWVSCSHVATEAGLKSVYSNGGQIFIFESYITCQNCFDKIPTSSLVDLLYDGELMTDALFQKKIIDLLYPINYHSLQTVGHFDFMPA